MRWCQRTGIGRVEYLGERNVERIDWCWFGAAGSRADGSTRPLEALPEHHVEVPVDLLRGRHHRNEVPPQESSDGVLGEEIGGVGGCNYRSPELAFDGYHAVMAREFARQDCGRGRIDAVGVEIDELKIALVCHVSDGLHVAHEPIIGRLPSNIE